MYIKEVRLFKRAYMINGNKNDPENEKIHRITRPRNGHKYTIYRMCLSLIMAICIKQRLRTFETQLMKNLSNTEAELKKCLPY